jgi:hypothetical protein
VCLLIDAFDVTPLVPCGPLKVANVVFPQDAEPRCVVRLSLDAGFAATRDQVQVAVDRVRDARRAVDADASSRSPKDPYVFSAAIPGSASDAAEHARNGS